MIGNFYRLKKTWRNDRGVTFTPADVLICTSKFSGSVTVAKQTDGVIPGRSALDITHYLFGLKPSDVVLVEERNEWPEYENDLGS